MARAGLVVREAVSISCAGPRKLKEVVGGADHRPLGTHFLDTAHEELPEPSRRLDLPEHRLDNLLPEAVSAAPAAAFKLSLHRLGQRAEGLAFGCGRVLGPRDGDIALDGALLESREVRLRAVAGIRRRRLWPPAEMRLDIIKPRCELILVALAVGQAVRDDDLRLAIHRGLRVVGLNEPVPGLHDAALGIGKVALRLAVRLAAPRLRLLAGLLAPRGP